MTEDLGGTLEGFSPSARRAIELAEVEATELGHDRVGTEHLLLGLLANETSGAAGILGDAGLTLAAARHKVSEAVGEPPAAAARSGGPLPRTPRAARALGRAVRFSHARRSEVVASELVLLGVLDVEGTAGQVLRGLGIDVDRLRASLDAGETPETPDAPGLRGGARPTACPTCGTSLDGALVYRTVVAFGDRGARDAVVYSCAACGRFLGVGPA